MNLALKVAMDTKDKRSNETRAVINYQGLATTALVSYLTL